MKKEINSKSRRKWIMGGLAAFASVALLTTGFAVWVVGVTKDKVNGDIGVTVDTAKNESVLFTVELDSNDKKIVLGEPAVIDKGFVRNSDVMEDFSIKFSKFEISVGKDVVNKFNRIELSLITEPSKDNGGAIEGKTFVDNKAGGAKLASSITNVAEKGRPETGATYFDLVTTTIDLPTEDTTTGSPATSGLFMFNRTTTSNTVKYTLVTSAAFKLFQWGTFFGGDSPCTFYNRVLTDEHQTPDNADSVQQEIKDMHDKLDGKDICLNMKLVEKTA